ncbi:T9SS type A sorting domain-containing protein [Bacteroidota bacterium]
MKQGIVIAFILLGFSSANSQCLDTLQFPNLQPPCNPDFFPVCGCDAVTYRNFCYADFATVLQYTDGPCKQIALNLYPNPVTDILYLNLATKAEGDVNLYIYDRFGVSYYRQYLSNVTNETIYIPVYNFSRGLYIVVAESKGEISLSKFIRFEQ